ncbi:MAG: cytochrome c4 [Gammaproteobacteria bacterium]|jgi:cytochrome c553|nr:cytochrome c4 [Gammaproteobacteria bacterium]MBT5202795.1 cytochrome c4 [Gammaproteobacteria bacterium]MBT5603091.1 cytochrome c4 [Gammaproteobacteria bacterium]MBT6246873.1 cytochrome c4 [Gammaproteobacteria bacterium]
MLRLISGIGLLMLALTAVAQGDAARGETLTMMCVACHGQDGNSFAGSFPNIAGQNQNYLVKQMQEIQSGERPALLMTGMLADMSDQDLRDLAAYYATKTASHGSADPARVELGESIYRSGIARKGIAACTACHSPTGQGNSLAGFPVLAGQWPEYTQAQLKAFRSGERHNDGDDRMMRLSAMDLNDEEIAAVASYLYGLQ